MLTENENFKRVAHRKSSPPSGPSILIQGVFDESFFDLLKERRLKEVYVLEGRPKLEALRHSCEQLVQRGITPTVIADNMAGFLFYKDLVQDVWLSYQVADSGRVLCDIGALILGVLGKKHGIPVRCYPAGKKSNLTGSHRDICYFNGTRVVSDRVKGYVPLLEWVPSKYISETYE